jgi:peptidoglycan/xylan/chitin deacetylase (PgdA/CDA1 family)
MNIRRYLLCSSYKLLEKAKYIDLRNKILNYAHIIAFHRVNDYDENSLTTSTTMFEQMMYEIRTHYTPVSLETLVNEIKNGKGFRPKSVAITFDDGYEDDFLNALPILRKYHIPATFFITSGYVNSNRIFPWDEGSPVRHPIMSWDQVRELSGLGFEIGAHTINHVDLGKVAVELAREEIGGSKARIEREIGKTIKAFAVPFGYKGSISKEIIEIVRETGFECCCSAHGGKVTRDSDLFDLHRVSMYPTIIEMKMELDNFMTYFDGRMSINVRGYKNPWDDSH